MTIQDLLKKRDVEFLESGHHHCREGWIQLRECVFCHSDNYHLGFCLRSQRFVCWRCGGHYTGSTLLRLGFAKAQVEEFVGDAEVGEVRPKRRLGLKEPAGRGELLKPHRDYLRGRGFDPAELQRLWQIEGIGIAARLSWRIYIPIIEGNVRQSWTTRTIGDSGQRYLSASAEEEAVNHKHLVYGIDYCRHSVVVVEGPIDAWAIGPGAGAVFGTAYSTAQVRRLISIPLRFVCFDASKEAQAKARELCGELSLFRGKTVNICLDAKDPGCAGAKELAQLRRFARL